VRVRSEILEGVTLPVPLELAVQLNLQPSLHLSIRRKAPFTTASQILYANPSEMATRVCLCQLT
jgi:hypothetical protein